MASSATTTDRDVREWHLHRLPDRDVYGLMACWYSCTDSGEFVSARYLNDEGQWVTVEDGEPVPYALMIPGYVHHEMKRFPQVTEQDIEARVASIAAAIKEAAYRG